MHATLGSRALPSTLPRPDAPPSPPAVRPGRPRWPEVRLVVGLVLLLGSVALGARAMAAARGTTDVLATVTALPAGHVLADGDLAPRPVRLGSAGSAYLDAGTRRDLVGRVLTRAVGAGELLPAASVAEGGEVSEVVPLLVSPARRPLLTGGDLVDVWSTFATGDQGCVSVAVARGLEVVTPPDDAAGPDAALAVRAPGAAVAGLVHASAATTLLVVRHLDARDAPASPTREVAGLVPTAACGPHA